LNTIFFVKMTSPTSFVGTRIPLHIRCMMYDTYPSSDSFNASGMYYVLHTSISVRSLCLRRLNQ
jgi:hypothetical protein